MKYETELMRKILTSEYAKKLIDIISPIYGNSYTGLWILEAIGEQIDDMYQWSEEIYLQTDPQTATWTIDLWEQEYGIVPGINWSLEQRQNNVVGKIKQKAPMNPARLAEILSSVAGIPVQIVENDRKNHFTISMSEFTCELSRMRKLIDQAKPAHLITVILFYKNILVPIPFKMVTRSIINVSFSPRRRYKELKMNGAGLFDGVYRWDALATGQLADYYPLSVHVRQKAKAKSRITTGFWVFDSIRIPTSVKASRLVRSSVTERPRAKLKVGTTGRIRISGKTTAIATIEKDWNTMDGTINFDGAHLFKAERLEVEV